MIIPQSFQFVGQIVRLLCFLQSVKNDTLGVAGTLARAREIVNDMTMVLRKFWAALGRRRTITRDEQWFLKDGATPHTSSNTLLWLKPVLNWANVCSPNILRTVRRTMIRFLIELLVRRTWFGQFDELYFVLNWLVMRCKLRPELAADAQQTA